VEQKFIKPRIASNALLVWSRTPDLLLVVQFNGNWKKIMFRLLVSCSMINLRLLKPLLLYVPRLTVNYKNRLWTPKKLNSIF